MGLLGPPPYPPVCDICHKKKVGRGGQRRFDICHKKVILLLEGFPLIESVDIT